jgi:sialidase-1
MLIEKLDEVSIYENPVPVLRSRAAKFPGMTRLPSGELLALFELGEAFESVDSRTVLSRSKDNGRIWELQGELYDQSQLGLPYPCSECLKPLWLREERLIATGYRFHRRDPNQTIANPETGGLLPADIVICSSSDLGRTWTLPRVVKHEFPEPLEFSGSCVETASGDLLGTAATFKCWDGGNPSGMIGILFRSRDKGQTWDSSARYFMMPKKDVVPFETRMIEMQPGRLVTLSWAYDMVKNRSLNNHVTVSHDNGYTWSAPVDIGLAGQASNFLWLGGEQVLSIHAHREGDTGIYVRLVDFTKDRWQVKHEMVIWGRGKIGANPTLTDHFWSIKFGQPSLLRLSEDEFLAYHWAVQDMQYKIKAHRLRLRLS